MTHGSLFSGIGGFDLAAEWMGWENIFHCEIAEFPRQILKYHFPNSICYEDIKKTDFTKHRGEVDIISGGFPCQPYSNAGKRRGKEDDRHLWPEMLRVIREVQPRFVVGENVSGLLTWNNGMVFHEIITDLENEGYETQAVLIPACSTNAPHRRDRIWFVAHSVNCGYNAERGKETEKDGIQSKIGKAMDTREFNGTSVSRITAHTDNGSGLRDTVQSRRTELEELHDSPSNVAQTDGTEQRNNLGENIGKEGEIRWGEEGDVFGELRGDGNVADTDSKRRDQRNTTTVTNKQTRFNSEKNFTNHSNWENFPTQSPVCGGDDGIPTELDGITFPKWRNESIKGYGNAVVPQVVYQIFKAIEQSLLSL